MLKLSVTYPLDLTKTRMQIQGEIDLPSKTGTRVQLVHRGMVHTAIGIGKYGGYGSTCNTPISWRTRLQSFKH